MSPSHSARDNCGFLVLLKSNFSLPRCCHTDPTNKYLDSIINWTNYNQPDILKIHSQPETSFDKHWSSFWCVWKDISEVSLAAMNPIDKSTKLGKPRFVWLASFGNRGILKRSCTWWPCICVLILCLSLPLCPTRFIFIFYSQILF